MTLKELNIKSSTIEKGLELAKDFLGKLISPTIEEALVDLMCFGWWNCAIRHIQPEIPGDIIFKEFKKQFIKLTQECGD